MGEPWPFVLFLLWDHKGTSVCFATGWVRHHQKKGRGQHPLLIKTKLQLNNIVSCAALVLSPTWAERAILLPNFSFVVCLPHQNAWLFLFPNTMGIPPSPPPSSENSQTRPGEIQMHKATGEAGPVFSTQSSPVTGATTMHYPAMIDRVGLCRLGELGRLRWGPVIWAPFHATCREKEILCWDWLFSEF